MIQLRSARIITLKHVVKFEIVFDVYKFILKLKLFIVVKNWR